MLYFLLKQFGQLVSVKNVLEVLMNEYAVDCEKLKKGCEGVIDFAANEQILREVKS